MASNNIQQKSEGQKEIFVIDLSLLIPLDTLTYDTNLLTKKIVVKASNGTLYENNLELVRLLVVSLADKKDADAS